MSFIDRLKTTLRADANGLIDAIEDPRLMLEQHLRDAELAVRKKQARLAELDAETKRLHGERERAEAERSRLDRDAELALAQDRDDLARYALGLLVTKRRLSEHIDARLGAIAEERQDLVVLLAVQTRALEELRARVQAYLAESLAGTCGAGFEPVSDEQIEIELLRRKSARTAPGTSEGRDEKA